jgi:hypothetical protein
MIQLDKVKREKQPIRSDTRRTSTNEAAPEVRPQSPLEDVVPARDQLLRLFGRLERTAQKIDEAFAGQPFNPNFAPDAPANRRRFNAYFKQHKQVAMQVCHAMEAWMITCGMKREDDWTPIVVEEMRIKAQRDREGKPTTKISQE